jgi:hypothetical protein
MPEALLAGTFDVENYGDLLFPLVAQARLASAGIAVRPVSPTAGRVGYADALPPVAAAAMLDADDIKACGVLIGGGYIVIGQAASTLAEYAAAGVAGHAYPSLWLGATLAGALRDVPVVWNAPGVPFPFASPRRPMLAAMLAAADYVALRDTASAELLATPGIDIAVVPDTVFDLPMVWSTGALRETRLAVLQRHGIAPEARLLALHVRERALGVAGAAGIAAGINALAAAHGLLPVLLPLGRSLGDGPVAAAVATHLAVPHMVFDDAASLREIAGLIAGAALYVGGSMHGYVTAAAYGVPGVLVAIPAHRKFSGVLAHLDRPQDLARDWPQAFDRAGAWLATGEGLALPGDIGAALDRHWGRIVGALGQPEAARDRRLAFLRSYLRAGAQAGGAAWLVGPQLAGGLPVAG